MIFFFWRKCYRYFIEKAQTNQFACKWVHDYHEEDKRQRHFLVTSHFVVQAPFPLRHEEIGFSSASDHCYELRSRAYIASCGVNSFTLSVIFGCFSNHTYRNKLPSKCLGAIVLMPLVNGVKLCRRTRIKCESAHH